jgi:hypothetical protein
MKTSTFIWHVGNIAVHAFVFAGRFVGEGAWALGKLVLYCAPEPELDSELPGTKMGCVNGYDDPNFHSDDTAYTYRR